MIEVRTVRNARERRAVKTIRTQVFVEEQGCPPELEWDEHETRSRHIIGLLEERPVAAARWRAITYDGLHVAKLERFAVLQEYRGKGYGRHLVQRVMEDAQQAGFDDFLVHAQRHLEKFYHSFGFETIGGIFEEAGIEHVRMVRRSR